MHYSPFYKNYSAFVKAKDGAMVKDILTSEIADAVVNRREEVIDKLNHSGLYVDSSVTTKQLSAIVSDNLSNPRFSNGLSNLIATKHPDDFNHYSNAAGKSGSKGKYFDEISFAVSGNVGKGDAQVVAKVKDITGDDSDEKALNRKATLTSFSIVGVCALAVYLIGIKKIV